MTKVRRGLGHVHSVFAHKNVISTNQAALIVMCGRPEPLPAYSGPGNGIASPKSSRMLRACRYILFLFFPLIHQRYHRVQQESRTFNLRSFSYRSGILRSQMASQTVAALASSLSPSPSPSPSWSRPRCRPNVKILSGQTFSFGQT